MTASASAEKMVAEVRERYGKIAQGKVGVVPPAIEKDVYAYVSPHDVRGKVRSVTFRACKREETQSCCGPKCCA